MLANKKSLVLIVFVLLIALGVVVTLFIAYDRTLKKDEVSTNTESKAAELDPAQNNSTSTNGDSKAEEHNHTHVHFDDGAVPVDGSGLDPYDYPTLPESLMKEFHDALLVLPSEDIYAEFFNWDDIDKDGDIREEKVRELIAIAKAMGS
jgi:hypothetical protein